MRRGNKEKKTKSVTIKLTPSFWEEFLKINKNINYTQWVENHMREYIEKNKKG